MKQTKIMMGMPVSVEIVGSDNQELFDAVYEYFRYVDDTFSTYKPDSEISRINQGLPADQWSKNVVSVMELADQTKQQTNGFFDVYHDGKLDPSGLVKGWAINNAAELLHKRGVDNFCIDVGGDMQLSGNNEQGQPWQIGIRNPFNREENIKVVALTDQGIATSGTAIRGQHIYNPYAPDQELTEVASITVIGPNVFEADRFATAAFAMGKQGVAFIADMKGFEAYMVMSNQMATMSNGFDEYVVHA